MAETPNNDIEKQLRDYAQQRRDAAGAPAMHPATRATLQAEVKQQFATTAAATGAPATPAQRSGWALFWPRFAFAFAIVAILGIAAILIFPPGNRPKENLTLAQLDKSLPAPPESDTAPAPVLSPAPAAEPPAPTGSASARREIASKSAASAPAPGMYGVANSPRSDAPGVRQGTMRAFKGGAAPDAPIDSLARNSLSGSSSVTVAKQEKSVALFDSSAQNATGSVFANGAINPGKSPFGGRDANIQPQTAVPVASEDSKERSMRIAGKMAETKNKDIATVQTRAANEGFNNSAQRYRNVAATDDLKKSGKVTVLDEFTVAQDGEALTVVDRDGSVYNGYARLAGTDRQNANAESGNPTQLVTNSGNGGRAGAAMNQSGMNRSSGQSQAPGQAGAALNLGVAQTSQLQNASELQNYFFRVEGTNRSLNQRVIFTGNMFQNNLGNAQNLGNNQVFRSQQNAASGNQYNFNNRQSPVQNNAINGRVQLDNTKPVEFNALSIDQ